MNFLLASDWNKVAKYCSFLFLVIFAHWCNCQDIESYLESLVQIQDNDLDYEEVYEALLQNSINPIDLNSATAEELHSLYILNVRQINAILKHREQSGPILSIYELQSISDLDIKTKRKESLRQHR